MVFDRYAAPEAPLTLQYPGVHVNIVHPDSDPPLILCEKVGGSPPVVAAPSKRHHLSVVPLLGADGHNRSSVVKSLQGLSEVTAHMS